MEDVGYKVNVICSSGGLLSLPRSLPPDTIFLYLDNNHVSPNSLEDLVRSSEKYFPDRSQSTVKAKMHKSMIITCDIAITY